MPASKNNDLSQELAKSLESATSLMNDLLGDIKDNATSLATLKVKLESLSDSVESLSHIVRDGNGKGSMVTRVALTEQSLGHIEDSFDADLNKEEIIDALTNEMQAAAEKLDFERAAELRDRLVDIRGK